jgi:hypothetical protein
VHSENRDVYDVNHTNWFGFPAQISLKENEKLIVNAFLSGQGIADAQVL